MTPKEYLRQAYRLNERINSHIEELENLRSLSTRIQGVSYGEHIHSPNRPTDAPFTKVLFKIMEYQDELNKKLNKLIKLKEEIKQVIDAVEDNDERAVLQYRYLKNYSWARIGDLLVADERTVRRWHNKALAHVVIPDNPTII